MYNTHAFIYKIEAKDPMYIIFVDFFISSFASLNCENCYFYLLKMGLR